MSDITGQTAPVGIGWNPAGRLRCVTCGETFDLGPAYGGCPACARAGGTAPLEVVYRDAPRPRPTEVAEVVAWLREHRQPIDRKYRVSLGRPVTPLVPLPAFGSGVYVKNETVNPTWGHKDRLHEVAVGAARLLGARGILATSTGNHGAAAAAHAAAAGLPSVIFCHPRASSTVLGMIHAYGGLVAQLDADDTLRAVATLVDDGWFPATSMDPDLAGRANPYGAEGYKEIAYETVEQLHGVPAFVVVPTASGDTVYGVTKGFAEISELTDLPMPTVVAGQPAKADALVRSLQAGHPVTVPDADSIALSVADPVSGRQSLAALRRWHGEAVAVSEDEIRRASRDYARSGLLVEPASAVSLAVYRQLRDASRLGVSDVVVLLATSSGAKWPDELAELHEQSTIYDAAVLTAALSRSAR